MGRMGHMIIRGGEWYPENSGSRKFCSNFEISEEFSMSLEISFSCVSLRLGFSNFWLRGLGFCFMANGFDQNHEKIVYLIKKGTVAVFRIQ